METRLDTNQLVLLAIPLGIRHCRQHIQHTRPLATVPPVELVRLVIPPLLHVQSRLDSIGPRHTHHRRLDLRYHGHCRLAVQTAYFPPCHLAYDRLVADHARHARSLASLLCGRAPSTEEHVEARPTPKPLDHHHLHAGLLADPVLSRRQSQRCPTEML